MNHKKIIENYHNFVPNKNQQEIILNNLQNSNIKEKYNNIKNIELSNNLKNTEIISDNNKIIYEKNKIFFCFKKNSEIYPTSQKPYKNINLTNDTQEYINNNKFQINSNIKGHFL